MNKHTNHRDYICANAIRDAFDAFGYFGRYSIHQYNLLSVLLADWIRNAASAHPRQKQKAKKCRAAAMHLIERKYANFLSRTLQAVKQNDTSKAWTLFNAENKNI